MDLPASPDRHRLSLRHILDELEDAAPSTRLPRDTQPTHSLHGVRTDPYARASPPRVALGFPYTLAPPAEDHRPASAPQSPPRIRAASSSAASSFLRYVGSPDSASSSAASSPSIFHSRDDSQLHGTTAARPRATPQSRKPVARAASASSSSAASSSQTAEQKRLARQCTVDGCLNYTIDRGLCFRHGGGKSCSIDSCTSSAKARGFCWRHGGSVLCTIPGCGRGAKSRGLCWSHGGGTKCSVDGCAKTTISKGLCWTHGGGKRCSFEGCKRPASEKKHNFCPKHHAQVSQADYVYEI